MNGYKQVREIYIFAGVLVLQSLPFLSAVAIALLENSRDQFVRLLAQQRGAHRGTDRARARSRLPTVARPSQPVASEIRREAN